MARAAVKPKRQSAENSFETNRKVELSRPHEVPAVPTPGQFFRTFIDTYRDDPVAFAEDVLRMDLLDWQKQFLRAVARGERRISVRAGHGAGCGAVVRRAVPRGEAALC